MTKIKIYNADGRRIRNSLYAEEFWAKLPISVKEKIPDELLTGNIADVFDWESEEA